MQKYSFLDDYSEGCHPNILEALSETNLDQQTAYGFDAYSNEAKQAIQDRLHNPDSQIYFVSGGTQANLIVSAASLRPHEAVISADIGHVLCREAGALEATGHKIISMKTSNGKLGPETIQSALDDHIAIPHMVKPKLVYISNATEIGTIYTKRELESLHTLCKQNKLYLFLDGARLGSALCARNSDVSLEDLAKLTDVFTIGGTKNGALIAEAIVLNNLMIAEDFNFHIKQRGGLLAKGRLLGIQFLELFKDDLYFDLAKHANRMAEKISEAFVAHGFELLDKTQTNQIFLILPNDLIAKLEHHFSFYVWRKHDEQHSVVRLVTSWATDEIMVDNLINTLK
jgi:threonine aldolase